jgi:hypothetical protein
VVQYNLSEKIYVFLSFIFKYCYFDEVTEEKKERDVKNPMRENSIQTVYKNIRLNDIHIAF